MISLNQVLLLEEKVESAVKKISQLNAENAALRKRCAELTNALSVKTEQFSSFQQNQNKIEEGILKALDRLNAVENSILSVSDDHILSETKAAEPAADLKKENIDTTEESITSSQRIQMSDAKMITKNVSETESEISAPEISEQVVIEPETQSDTESFPEPMIQEENKEQPEEESSQGLFDIF